MSTVSRLPVGCLHLQLDNLELQYLVPAERNRCKDENLTRLGGMRQVLACVLYTTVAGALEVNHLVVYFQAHQISQIPRAHSMETYPVILFLAVTAAD